MKTNVLIAVAFFLIALNGAGQVILAKSLIRMQESHLKLMDTVIAILKLEQD